MKKVAFFDLDGTLVTCQTQEELARVFRSEKLLSLNQTVQVYFWFLMYKIGLIKKSIKIRQKVYRVFSLRPKKDIDNLFNKAFHELIKPKISRSLLLCLEKHKQNGDLIICVSGTLNYFCQLICQELSIKEFYGTKLEVKNDRYTGNWENEILEGEEKALFVKRFVEKNKIDLKDCYAYCDSMTDVPLLEIVGNPVVVSNDKKLLNKALLNSWQILK